MPSATTFGKRGVTAGPAFAPSLRQDLPAAVQIEPEVRRFALPWLTCAMLLALAAIYVVEVAVSAAAGHPGKPSHSALLKLGGLSGDLVFHSGQAWRVLTAPMLHLSPAHLIGNGVALFLVGLLLEPIVGRRWFAFIYFVGGLGGAAGSLLLNPGALLGVGASGAIMGVLSCALVLSFHVACHEKSRRMRILSVRVMIPALLPLASTAGGQIDYSAHLGGALAGMAMGFALQIIWAEDRARPPHEAPVGQAAAAFAGLSLMAFALAAILPTSAPAQPTTPGLIPIDDLPDSLNDGVARSAELLEQYPADPRSHIFAGVRMGKAGDQAGEAMQFALALQSPLIDSPELPHGTAASLRPVLVALYVKAGKIDEARVAAAPLCAAPAQTSPQARALIHAARLCEPVS